MGPAEEQFPATSHTVCVPVCAVDVSVPAVTAVKSVKLASAALAKPEPVSLAVQAMLTSLACHEVSGLAQVICGGAESAAPPTWRVAWAVFPLSVPVTVCDPALLAVQFAPVHD